MGKIGTWQTVCLESSRRRYKPKPETFATRVTPSHTATKPLQTCKVRNSSSKGREAKTVKDSEKLVVLYACLPSGTSATAQGVRCQSLSNMGHPSNPIQWQRGSAGCHSCHLYKSRHHLPLPGPESTCYRKGSFVV